MPEYKLRILKTGEADVPGPEVYWQSHWFSWETLHFNMVVIHGEGITALINTGPPPDLTALNRNWMSGYNGEERTKMRRREEERPLAALASVGLKPTDVQYVFITPIQAYAIGNVSLFAAAKKIFISRRGWIEGFFAPPRQMGSPRECVIPEDQVVYLTTRAIDRVHLVGEEEEVLPGIKAIWAGVHHSASMAISIPTKKGRVVVSDSCFKYGNIEENHPLGLCGNLEECYATYARIRREADIVLPLYDPEILVRHPGGLIE
jgi:glyoxylase-like metal-dependent hydrolase (beta-lactamase superfamily II)